METMHPILIIQLEGVLQSWGDHSQWDTRDTAAFPGKSALIGLIGCAMGLQRGDSRLEELNSAFRMAVRADRPGVIMEDFHTVTAENMPNAANKTRGNTIVTTRYYLQDAAFTVAIDGEKTVLEAIQQALENPVWPVCLGRKSCVPSRPVLGKLIQAINLMEALKEVPLMRHSSDLIPVETEEAGDGHVYYRTDSLVRSKGRIFGSRAVYRHTLKEAEICTCQE